MEVVSVLQLNCVRIIYRQRYQTEALETRVIYHHTWLCYFVPSKHFTVKFLHVSYTWHIICR